MNTIDKSLGEITGLLKGMDSKFSDKFDDQGDRIDGLRDSIAKTFDKIEKVNEKATKNMANIGGIEKDIRENVKPKIGTLEGDIKKQSLKAGGVSGAGSGAIMIGLKEIWDYISTGGGN